MTVPAVCRAQNRSTDLSKALSSVHLVRRSVPHWLPDHRECERRQHDSRRLFSPEWSLGSWSGWASGFSASSHCWQSTETRREPSGAAESSQTGGRHKRAAAALVDLEARVR